jgi:hypothetical protein
MSKTEFSLLPQHEKLELIQNVIDLLLYSPKISKKIIKIVEESPKAYKMEPVVMNGQTLEREVRTIRLEDVIVK